MKFKMKNGKEALIRKEIFSGTYVAYYNGPEGESLFLVNDEQIENGSSLPFIFWDFDERKKRGRK